MIDLFVKRSGKGDPVILLHGYMESSSMWEGLFDLDLGIEWLAFDLPGHGCSPLEETSPEPSIDYYSHQIVDYLKANKIDDFHVVGHSMGGYVALRIKEMHSGCRKVILLNSNPWEDAPQKKLDRLRVADIAYKAKELFIQQAVPALFYKSGEHKTVIKQLIEEASHMTPDAIAYAALAMRTRQDKTAVIQRNSSDFLILQGNHDPLIPRDNMENWSTINAIPIEILNDSGHMSHLEEPLLVSQCVQRFILG